MVTRGGEVVVVAPPVRRTLTPLNPRSKEWALAWMSVASYDAGQGAADDPRKAWTYVRTIVSLCGTGIVHEFQSVSCVETKLEIQATKAYAKMSPPAPRKRRVRSLDCEDGIDERAWDRAMTGGGQ